MNYVLIDAQTRKHATLQIFATKAAASRRVTRLKQEGIHSFIVAIPDKDLVTYTAAYIREHGTIARTIA